MINTAGTDGLIYGNASFFLKQIVAVLSASIYAFIFTYVMLIIINLITPVKVSEEEEKQGLDTALHGERAYDEGAM
jgi:Amt family ammonium transporter